MTLTTQRPRAGTSLPEVIVVVGVMGVLAGLLLSGVQAARGAAARAGCQNNLRQVGLALHQFHDANGRLPAGPPGSVFRVGPVPVVTWMAFLLPHLDQGPLWARTEAALREKPADASANPPHVGLAAVIPAFRCPADGRLVAPLVDRDGIRAGYTSYIGVSGGRARDGVMRRYPGTRFADVTDGLSGTLAVAERPPPDTLQAGKWYTWGSPAGVWGHLYGPDEALSAESGVHPDDPCRGPMRYGPGRLDNPCDRYHYWSLHPGGANFLFCDGSARTIRFAAAGMIPALATRAGGEPGSDD